MRRVIEDAVVRGQDSRTTAKQVQKYMQPNVWTAHKAETRRKLGVHKDVSYEAMRLARTEMNNAFHEGAIAANQHSPGYLGIYWKLSAAHVIPDICTDMATDMSHGAPGFYPKGLEPTLPHPQCMCSSISRWEDPQQFAERLREWIHEPHLQPDIEAWYNEDAKHFIGRPATLPFTPQEVALAKVLRQKETEIAQLEYERAYAFDRQGKALLTKDGSRNEIAFTLDERRLIAGKDVVLTHNHPDKGGSFSLPDILFSSVNDLGEMRAVGKKYVHSMKRPLAGWADVEEFKREYTIASNAVRADLIKKINAGKMTIGEAEREHHHLAWMRVKKVLNLNYKREIRRE
ncbi:MAG: hypothetical protein ACLKAK_07250 [Alkaliphilus sp.]